MLAGLERKKKPFEKKNGPARRKELFLHSKCDVKREKEWLFSSCSGTYRVNQVRLCLILIYSDRLLLLLCISSPHCCLLSVNYLSPQSLPLSLSDWREQGGRAGAYLESDFQPVLNTTVPKSGSHDNNHSLQDTLQGVISFFLGKQVAPGSNWKESCLR